MARKKLKLPNDFKSKDQRKKIEEQPHFDIDCSIYAEKHYGAYLIVQNSAKADQTRKHNRFYLDAEKELEFLLKTGYGQQGLNKANHTVKHFHLFTEYPKHQRLIQILISKIKRYEKRNTVRDLLYGIGIMLNLFESANKEIPNHPNKFNADTHQKHLYESVLAGRISVKNQIRALGAIWSFIRHSFNNKAIGILPNQVSPQRPQVNSSEVKDNEITLEVLFQLDYYSQMELGHIITKAKEYKKWIEELDKHGELFSRANLLRTCYNYKGKKSIRQLYILLYKEEPLCLNSDKKRHKKLLDIAKNGIDISVKNEKMFAWWHKTLFPNWPFVKKIKEPYNNIFTNSDSWLSHYAKTAKISLVDFNERIFPNLQTLYPMYLRLLIDTSANTDTISNTTVYQKDDGTYEMGVVHHNLRMLDAVKKRTNTITPSFITKGTFTDQCVDFYTQWLSILYQHSNNSFFLQYINNYGRSTQLDSEKIKRLNPMSLLRKRSKSKGRTFFEKYEIYKNIEGTIDTDTTQKKLGKERVWWIKHMNIRAANNFKNYHLAYGDWVRSHVTMGQQDEQTEQTHYRKDSWRLGDEHQTAVSLLHIQEFIEGKITDKTLENAFEQPHCSCVDNKNPSFNDAPHIKDDEICTSWRYCLTRCENSYVFPEHHGPTIMAWKKVMEQERENFIRLEDWSKEYGEDYEATIAIISKFKPEHIEFSKSKAAERMPFIHLMMMQTKKKKKANQLKPKAINE